MTFVVLALKHSIGAVCWLLQVFSSKWTMTFPTLNRTQQKKGMHYKLTNIISDIKASIEGKKNLREKKNCWK